MNQKDIHQKSKVKKENVPPCAVIMISLISEFCLGIKTKNQGCKILLYSHPNQCVYKRNLHECILKVIQMNHEHYLST